MTVNSKYQGHVLQTGASGFIGSHILDMLLDRKFLVTVAVRSEKKGRAIINSLLKDSQGDVNFVIVPEIEKDGAFDEAVQTEVPLDYIIHTASPCQIDADDLVRDILEPAIRGTTGILKSAAAYAPSVRRVVITSSAAAIVNPKKHRAMYNEQSWPDFTIEDGKDVKYTYPVSKTFAEKAAWEFMSTTKPSFSLSVINNSYTFGAIPRSLASLTNINMTNKHILDLVSGTMRNGITDSPHVRTFVNVHEVALAHVKAMTVPEAAGERFFVIAGFFSMKKIVEILREKYPELDSKLPPSDMVEDDFPKNPFGIDNSKSTRILGIQYSGLEDCVVEAADSILQFRGEGQIV